MEQLRTEGVQCKCNSGRPVTRDHVEMTGGWSVVSAGSVVTVLPIVFVNPLVPVFPVLVFPVLVFLVLPLLPAFPVPSDALSTAFASSPGGSCMASCSRMTSRSCCGTHTGSNKGNGVSSNQRQRRNEHAQAAPFGHWVQHIFMLLRTSSLTPLFFK